MNDNYFRMDGVSNKFNIRWIMILKCSMIKEVDGMSIYKMLKK